LNTQDAINLAKKAQSNDFAAIYNLPITPNDSQRVVDADPFKMILNTFIPG
jgi:hypothetical protein